MLKGKHGKPITLDVTYPEPRPGAPARLPLLVFCHGFKGFKDWGTFPLMAAAFARQGFFFVKFNFSHNGTTAANFSDIHDLEAFGHNNFEIELDDLGSVIDWLVDPKNPYRELYASDELSLIGHSRGGGIALLKTLEDSRVKKTVCWSTVNDLEKYMYLSDPVQWKETGVSYVLNGRTGLSMPLYYQFYENYYLHKTRFDLKKNLLKLDKPLLLLHGTKDSTVEPGDSEWIYNEVPHSIYIPVEGSDHTFGGRHPWDKETLPEDLNFAIEETIEFLTF